MQETRRHFTRDHRPIREMQQATASIAASSRNHCHRQYLRDVHQSLKGLSWCNLAASVWLTKTVQF